jgi:signal transduction histidine kinase
VRNTAGEISRWYTFSIDVHDRKRAEEELRRKKALLAEGQHLSSTGTFSWRLDTDEVVFSEQACRIFDFDLNANLTPGCIGGRIHPDDLPTLTEKMNQARTNVVDHDFEVRLCMANGTVKYMHARSHATRHQDGHLEYVQRIMHDGRRASEVITRLRALFSNKDPVAERVDLNEASREVIALCSDELQRNRVLLRQELANDLPCVTGDRVQLQQAILNLLRYASDAMSGVKDRPRELVIRTERSEGSYVQLTVQNTGVGIRLQGLERLFEAFYTTKSDGMGIGLSVSHSIIERHGGRLWAAPNGGPGATFSFSVPSRLNNAAMLSTAG